MKHKRYDIIKLWETLSEREKSIIKQWLAITGQNELLKALDLVVSGKDKELSTKYKNPYVIYKRLFDEISQLILILSPKFSYIVNLKEIFEFLKAYALYERGLVQHAIDITKKLYYESVEKNMLITSIFLGTAIFIMEANFYDRADFNEQIEILTKIQELSAFAPMPLLSLHFHSYLRANFSSSKAMDPIVKALITNKPNDKLDHINNILEMAEQYNTNTCPPLIRYISLVLQYDVNFYITSKFQDSVPLLLLLKDAAYTALKAAYNSKRTNQLTRGFLARTIDAAILFGWKEVLIKSLLNFESLLPKKQYTFWHFHYFWGKAHLSLWNNNFEESLKHCDTLLNYWQDNKEFDIQIKQVLLLKATLLYELQQKKQLISLLKKLKQQWTGLSLLEKIPVIILESLFHASENNTTELKNLIKQLERELHFIKNINVSLLTGPLKNLQVSQEVQQALLSDILRLHPTLLKALYIVNPIRFLGNKDHYVSRRLLGIFALSIEIYLNVEKQLKAVL